MGLTYSKDFHRADLDANSEKEAQGFAIAELIASNEVEFESLCVKHRDKVLRRELFKTYVYGTQPSEDSE